MPPPTSTLDILVCVPELRQEIWPECLAPPADGSLPAIIIAFKRHPYHEELVDMYHRISGTIIEGNEAKWIIARPPNQTRKIRHLLLVPLFDKLQMRGSPMLVANSLGTITVDLLAHTKPDVHFQHANVTSLTKLLCRASLHLTKVTARGVEAYMEDFKRQFNAGLNVAGVSTLVLSQGTNQLAYEIMTWEAASGLVWS